jgi:collagenase-like PrtC family protease
MKHRKFSIPYNGSGIDFVRMVDNYQPCVDNIYFSIPEVLSHCNDEKIYNKLDEFLIASNGKYKRILSVNSLGIYDEVKLFNLFNNYVNSFIERYNVEGVITTSLNLAKKLRRDFPNIELHTSCNCFQYTTRQMDVWNNLVGIDVFNPPREAAKSPSMLKEMRNAGYKLKVIVNQACMYGCGYMLNHSCGITKLTEIDCGHRNPVNIFRTNVVIPEWLDYLDEYVDIYKIVGRHFNNNEMKYILDAYILGTPYKFLDEIISMNKRSYINILKMAGIRIRPDDIPSKTRYCEAKDCDKTCFVCRDAYVKLLHREGYNIK